MQKAVGKTYEKILVDLRIPYDYIEVEVEEVIEKPQLQVIKNGHPKT
jgi:hypothetical protein